MAKQEYIHVLEDEYYSKADAFILPLTGLEKCKEYDQKAYLFWNDLSIEDYKLMVTYSTSDKDKLLRYLKKEVFPILDKSGYLLENYDTEDRAIFVLDLSEWALDIEMFLMGRYSRFSDDARSKIKDFHNQGGAKIHITIFSALYPNKSSALLNNMSPMTYVAENYGLDLIELERRGELGSRYSKLAETLITDVSEKVT